MIGGRRAEGPSQTHGLDDGSREEAPAHSFHLITDSE